MYSSNDVSHASYGPDSTTQCDTRIDMTYEALNGAGHVCLAPPIHPIISILLHNDMYLLSSLNLQSPDLQFLDRDAAARHWRGCLGPFTPAYIMPGIDDGETL